MSGGNSQEEYYPNSTLSGIVVQTFFCHNGLYQPSGGETTWTNSGATRPGRGEHKTGSFGDSTLRPSPNHGTQRLPNDDDDEWSKTTFYGGCAKFYPVAF